MTYQDFKNRYIELLWRLLLGLFCFSIFTSKSGLVLFGSLLIICSIPLIDWPSFIRDRTAVLILSFYPLAAFCNLFSRAGFQAAQDVLVFWIAPLLALPAFLAVRRKNYYREMVWCVLSGLLIGCLYSYYNFIENYNALFAPTVRVPSFWDITRWGSFLSVGILGIFVGIMSGVLKPFQKLLACGLFIIALGSLILSNTRGPWLATILSIGIFIFIGVKNKIRVLAVGVALILTLFAFSTDVRSRFFSALDISIAEDGRLVSGDLSNLGRLKMWRASIDFFKEQPWFGTGYRSSEPFFRDFIGRNPQYSEDAQFSEFSFRDQHSSYLYLLVQMGVIFTFYFMFVILYCVWKSAKIWKMTRSSFMAFVIALSGLHLFLFIFYSSVDSYEMALFLPFLAVISMFVSRDTHSHGKALGT